MPKTLLPYLTRLCQDLLVEPDDPPPISHLTIHIPLQAISGVMRCGFDGCAFTTTFCITPQRMLGSMLFEPDGDYRSTPHLIHWQTLAEYLQHFPDIPPAESWTTLIPLFRKVEVIAPGQVEPSRLYLSGTELVLRPDLSTLLQPLQ